MKNQKEYYKDYYRKNKKKILKQRREYKQTEEAKMKRKIHVENNKEKIRQQQQAWKKKNQDKVIKARKKFNSTEKSRIYRKRYKEKYSDKLAIDRARQKHHKLMKLASRPKPKECEVCKKTGSVCFDHDHKTGKFRGWICRECNLALGLVKDNEKILISLSEYLSK